MKDDVFKRLTIDIPTILHCKIRARAAYHNMNLKQFVSTILLREITELERKEIEGVLERNKSL